MGLTAEADRNAILAAVKKIKAELPSGGMYQLQPLLQPQIERLQVQFLGQPFIINNKQQQQHCASFIQTNQTSTKSTTRKVLHRLTYPNLIEDGVPQLTILGLVLVHPPPMGSPSPRETSEQALFTEDTRSVEELLSFINGGTEPALGSSKHCPTTQLPGGASLPLARSPLQAFPSSLSGTVPLSSSPFPLSLSRPSPSPTLPNEAGPSVPSAKALRRARQRARRKLRSEQQAEPEETPPCSVDAASSRKATAGNPGKPPPTVTKTAQAGKRHLESSKTASSPGKAKHNSQKLAKELRHKSKNNRPLSVSTTAPNSLYQATKSSIKDVDPEEGLDPALEAQLDQEVEEFRLRLESHSASLERRPIPSSLRATLAQFNSRQLKPRSVK